MYDVTNVVEMIKKTAKEKGLSISNILDICELNKNTLSSMGNRGSWIKADSLAKIADCLDCSVDFLLGRTDERSVNSGNAINTGDITGNNNANMNIGNTKSDTDELIELFNSLSLVQKAEIILKINEMKNE